MLLLAELIILNDYNILKLLPFTLALSYQSGLKCVYATVYVCVPVRLSSDCAVPLGKQWKRVVITGMSVGRTQARSAFMLRSAFSLQISVETHTQTPLDLDPHTLQL